MKLSQRAVQLTPSEPRRIYDEAQKYRNVIDLTLGDPDLPPPMNVREAACEAIRAGKTRYSANAGVLALRQAIVAEALRLWDTTDGAFDITVYPLMELWGFTSQNFRVPAEDELERMLRTVGSDGLEYDAETGSVTLGRALGIDLGGIAKGYTSGRLMEVFEEYGLRAGLVSLGGNVQCCGTKPDGSAWRFGIQDPFEPNSGKFLGILSITDGAVITSGAYERFFEEDGETYHHILDPATGYPANHGLVSVTIVSPDGMLADGLSTSVYILGLEKATEYWREYGENFDMILMTEGGEVYVTEPIADRLTTDYPVTVITA